MTIPNAVGPYSVTWDFGVAATPNTVVVENVTGATSSVNVRLSSEGTFTGSATATQSGTGLIAGPFRFTFNVAPAPQIHVAAAVVAGNIVVTTNAIDTSLTFAVDAPTGFTVGTPQPSLVGGGAGALIPVCVRDPLAGASGALTVNVTGEAIAPATTTVNVSIPPIQLAPDTLYAIPLQRQVRVGEPVTVLVATGATANPFLYMVAVRLITEPDAAYVYGSLNFGSPGGFSPPPGQYWESRFYPDGIWAQFAAQPSWGGFLLAPDGEDFSFSFYSTIEDGRRAWDMNLTPLGAQPISQVSGALFNVQFKFTTPGTKSFAFQDVATVKRTYYADDAAEYFWGDVSNSHAGVLNSVDVLP